MFVLGWADGAGNIAKQGIMMGFGDQKEFDYVDLTKDIAIGVAMPKGLDKLGALTKGARGKGKKTGQK